MTRLAQLLRRIIGAPDYSVYLEHQRAHHPECEPLGEKEFVAERWKARYETVGSRCC